MRELGVLICLAAFAAAVFLARRTVPSTNNGVPPHATRPRSRRDRATGGHGQRVTSNPPVDLGSVWDTVLDSFPNGPVAGAAASPGRVPSTLGVIRSYD